MGLVVMNAAFKVRTKANQFLNRGLSPYRNHHGLLQKALQIYSLDFKAVGGRIVHN